MLVGRHAEQSVLTEMLATARAGRTSVLALIGEPGIGKSALVEDAEERACEREMNILTARGVESEAQIPFASLLELLRPALDALGQIPAPQARALEGALALRPPRSEDRFAIGAATLSLLAAHAERCPLLVTIDDAHWLDGSSADAVSFAARRLVEDPVAILFAVREGEHSLIDGTDLPRLHVDGLDRRSAGDLLRNDDRFAPAITEEQVDRLYSETRGNPLALLEMSRTPSWFQDSPVYAPVPVATSVAERFARGFESLTEGARQSLVLLAACHTGELAALVRAATALGLPLERDFAEAEAAGLIEVRGSLVLWRHPLARSAVYTRASSLERHSSHRALADALPDNQSDERAWHLALATFGPDNKVSVALEQAGERARSRSAYEVSSRTFERAASFATEANREGRLLYAAADAAWLAGLGDRALTLLDEAALRSQEAKLTIQIDQLRGHIATRRGQLELGREILVAAARRAAPVDPEAAVVMLAEAVNACFYAGDAAKMREIASLIPKIASECPNPRSDYFSLMSEGMALVFSGEGVRGPRLIRRAVELLIGSEEIWDDPRLLAWATMGPLWLREASFGRSLIDRALAVAREKSIVGVLPFVLSHVAFDLAESERWAEAEAVFYEAIDLARESGQNTELALSLARLSLLEARRGQEEACRQHSKEALDLSTRLGIGLCEVLALEALGDLELGLGRPDAALANYLRQKDAVRTRSITDADLAPEPELVEVYLRVGRPADAIAAAEAFWRDATTKGQPWAIARAGRARGLVAPDNEYEKNFTNAIAKHGETPDLFEEARTHLAYGSRLRRNRQRVRARAELRIAIDGFDRLGAAPWAEIASSELAASGERARRRHESARTQLTPQELQIALLLADRRTTREAAAALFLSPKTVEYHLRNIYRKLDVNNRDELAKAMKL